MLIVDTHINLSELSGMADNFGFGFVKAVVDISQETMAIDADLHADLERLLLSTGSAQDDLWGINLYPDNFENDFIEYDSLINIRPRQNNPSRYVHNEDTRIKIESIVAKFVRKDG